MQLESKEPRAAYVYSYFRYLIRHVSRAVNLPTKELLTIISRRWKQVATPLFTIAYICHPKARKLHKHEVGERQMALVLRWLKERYSESEAHSLYIALQNVWYRRGTFSNDDIWDAFDSYTDPGDWWHERNASSPQLRELAILALSLHPTSGGAERNWSTHGFLHSKSRNRLTNPRIEKLVFLFQNLRVRDEILTEMPEFFDEIEVSEASDDEITEKTPTFDEWDSLEAADADEMAELTGGTSWE